MPALPDAPGVLKVALSGTINATNPWLSRFFVHYTGTAPSTSQLATFNAAVASAYSSDIVSLATGAVELTQIETIDLTSPTSAVAVTAETISGSRSGTSIPAAAAMVTSYEISRRYRGGHPRGYWPWGVTGDITSDVVWAAAFVSASHTGITNLMTAVVAAGWTGAGTLTQVNVSYYEGFSVVTNPITHRARNVPTLRGAPVVDAITSIVARSSIGTQRRRNVFID